jgi:hypothetical protein
MAPIPRVIGVMGTSTPFWVVYLHLVSLRYRRGWGGTPVAAVPRWAQGSSAMTLGYKLD